MSREERKAMIVRDHPDLSVSRQCGILSIGRSSFYYRPRGESPETLALMRRVGADPAALLDRRPLTLEQWEADGPGLRLRAPRLPAPLHLGLSRLRSHPEATTLETFTLNVSGRRSFFARS